MLNNKYIVCLLSVFLILTNCDHNFMQMSFDLENFLDTVFMQNQIYEVILMSTNDKKNKYDPIENLIFTNVVSRYPTKNWNFYKSVLENEDEFGRMNHLILKKTTILFIIVLNINESMYEIEQDFLERLRAISTDTFISKFLIFVLHDKEGTKFDFFLKLAWKNELIDILVHEIVIKFSNDPHCCGISIIRKINSQKSHCSWKIFNNSSFISKSHSFNPFTNIYLQKYFDNKSVLFPNKVQNLHRYKLRMGVVDYPPYSDVEVTRNGEMVFMGPGGELIKTLIKHINFTLVPKIGTLSEYGLFLSNGSATGLLAKVKDNELDGIAFGAFVFYTSFTTEQIDRTTYIGVEEICAVVPLIRSKTFLVKGTVWISILTIVALAILLWLLSLLLRLSRGFSWHPLDIGLVILGMAAPGLPRNLRERFIYGSIIAISLIYSSYIFAQLTSVNFDSTIFKTFNSFEELNQSGLIPVVHPNLYNLTFKYGNKILQSLGRKSVLRSDYSQICPIWLWQKANVTCIIGSEVFNFLAKVHKEDPKRQMKLVSPCFWWTTRSYIMRKASPYTHRFNQVILRVIEAGYMKYESDRYVFEYTKKKNITLREPTVVPGERMAEAAKRVFKSNVYESFILISIGSLVSFCVFLGELFILAVQRWCKLENTPLKFYYRNIIGKSLHYIKDKMKNIDYIQNFFNR